MELSFLQIGDLSEVISGLYTASYPSCIVYAFHLLGSTLNGRENKDWRAPHKTIHGHANTMRLEMKHF